MHFFYCLLFVEFVFTLSSGQSSAQCANHANIKNFPAKLSKCDQLYSLLEEALISNSENLYALRRAFYPQTGRPAPLLCVVYNVTPNMESIANGRNGTSTEITIHRSMFSLFSVINPYILLEFISGYILLFVESNLEMENIVISLNSLDSTVIDPVKATEQELVETLEILTTRLEAYAKEQGKLTDWDGTGRGYTWKYEYLSRWFWVFLALDIFLSVIASCLPPQLHGTIKRILKNLTREDTGANNRPESRVPMEEERKAPQAVVIALAIVLTVICVLEFVCSIYITVRAATICPPKTCQKEVIPTRIAILCFTAVVGIVGSLLFGIVKGSLSRNGFLEKLKKSAKEFCIIAGFFILFLIIAVNIVPTIILGFIFPFEVITGVIYLLMICFIVLIFTGIDVHVSSEWKRINHLLQAAKHQGGGNGETGSVHHWEEEEELPCFTASAFYVLYHTFIVIIVILFVSASTIIFVVSLTVYSAEVDPSFVHTYYTLIPPIILFLLTTLAKKHIIDKVDPPRATKRIIPT